jgi:hypothetical protein
VKGKVRAQPTDPDWVRLLDAERALEEQIAAAEADARSRVAQARAAAASATPESDATARLAAAEEQADAEQHRSALAHLAAEADAAVRALTQAPDSLIETLAQVALGAVLTDDLPAERR